LRAAAKRFRDDLSSIAGAPATCGRLRVLHRNLGHVQFQRRDRIAVPNRHFRVVCDWVAVEILEYVTPALRARFLQHPQARPHEVEIEAVRTLLHPQVASAVLHVGNALDRHRVRPQISRRRAFVDARP
jgi:hypothetical protein